MMLDKIRAQDIWMGLAALTISPESKQVEESLVKMLLQNHTRALQAEQEENVQPPIEQVESNSPNTVEIGDTSLKDKINELEGTYLNASAGDKLQNTKTLINAGMDNSGLGLYTIHLQNSIVHSF